MKHWSVHQLLTEYADANYRDFEEFLNFKTLVKKPLIIYGAGHFCRQLLFHCQQNHLPVAAVCDTRLAGQVIDGIGKIQSFEEILPQVPNCQVVIASLKYRNEIEQTIRKAAPDCEILFFAFPLITIAHRQTPEDFKNFLQANSVELDGLWEKLGDELSRKTLDALLRAKLTWDITFLEKYNQKDQYFPDDLIRFTDDEVLFDCGAWQGDTLEEWIKKTGGHFKKAVCFEPGAKQARELSRTFKREIQEGRVELVPKCVSDKEGTVYFAIAEDTTKSHITGEEKKRATIQVQSTTIDLVAGEDMDVTFIKMDIEGAELAALKGAEQTIRRCRPKLAICVYHRVADIIDIPQYIDSLQLGYRYFLRHHSDSVCETVFYAIP